MKDVKLTPTLRYSKQLKKPQTFLKHTCVTKELAER